MNDLKGEERDEQREETPLTEQPVGGGTTPPASRRPYPGLALRPLGTLEPKLQLGSPPPPP